MFHQPFLRVILLNGSVIKNIYIFFKISNIMFISKYAQEFRQILKLQNKMLCLNITMTITTYQVDKSILPPLAR